LDLIIVCYILNRRHTLREIAAGATRRQPAPRRPSRHSSPVQAYRVDVLSNRAAGGRGPGQHSETPEVTPEQPGTTDLLKVYNNRGRATRVSSPTITRTQPAHSVASALNLRFSYCSDAAGCTIGPCSTASVIVLGPAGTHWTLSRGFLQLQGRRTVPARPPTLSRRGRSPT
jgi:hypothetical protein